MRPNAARRQRQWFSVGAGLVALVLLAPLAYLAYGRDAERARQETLDWAGENMATALIIYFRTDEIGPPDNTWEVNVDDDWS